MKGIEDSAFLIPIIGLENGWEDRERISIIIKELTAEQVTDVDGNVYSLKKYNLK